MVSKRSNLRTTGKVEKRIAGYEEIGIFLTGFPIDEDKVYVTDPKGVISIHTLREMGLLLREMNDPVSSEEKDLGHRIPKIADALMAVASRLYEIWEKGE